MFPSDASSRERAKLHRRLLSLEFQSTISQPTRPLFRKAMAIISPFTSPPWMGLNERISKPANKIIEDYSRDNREESRGEVSPFVLTSGTKTVEIGFFLVARCHPV